MKSKTIVMQYDRPLSGPEILEIYKRGAGGFSFEGWHPVDGKLRHIVQVTHQDGRITFYTDGVEQETPMAFRD